MRNEYDQADVGRMIGELTSHVAAAFDRAAPLNLIGIRTRGHTLADRLERSLAAAGFTQLGRGVLDITLYRDDLSEIGPRPLVRPTRIDVELNGRPTLLVDDVIFTGRSVRAALDAISDFGRPSAVRVAVLVDRGGRELPIHAEFVALKLKDVPRDHRVKVQFEETDGRDGIVVEPIPR